MTIWTSNTFAIQTRIGRYEPDFYLPSEDVYIEVKARCWIQKRDAKQHYKICVLRTFHGYDIHYRFKDDLEERGIL